jgi:hypothetical protein
MRIRSALIALLAVACTGSGEDDAVSCDTFRNDSYLQVEPYRDCYFDVSDIDWDLQSEQPFVVGGYCGPNCGVGGTVVRVSDDVFVTSARTWTGDAAATGVAVHIAGDGTMCVWKRCGAR